MTRFTLCTCIVLASLSLSACDRDKSAPPTPTTKPDTITPAPMRPGDPTTPAVPGPGSSQPMPEIGKK